MSKELDITMKIKMNNKCFVDIEKLAMGDVAEESQIIDILNFIDTRYDCADFRMICILRSLYKYSSFISESTLQLMKNTVLSFKYWMDEPGEDSMCYWSENHQLLFAACEYLGGQLYPEETFTNNQMTGIQHLKKAEGALNRWLERRFQYGFIEWHSNTYYEEDIAPLSLIIDFCKDQNIVKKATIIMDLLMLDLALHSFKGLLAASSGRCYELQKKDPYKQDVMEIIEKAFGFGYIEKYDYSRLSTDFILNESYVLPKVIYDIAHCEDTLEIRNSMGLNLKEIKNNFKDDYDINDAGMFLWAMEAFTNPESVNITLDIFKKWNLRSNDFLKDIKVLDIPLARELNLLPLAVKVLNPVTQGIAIQRANTYTYKTKHYMLSTAQNYHPQEFGDQQHIWQATLDGGISVFTTHPAAAFFDDNARNFSPSYWVGNGINPHSVQYKNIGLSIYNLKIRKGFLEKSRPMLSHAYFPFDKFDQVFFNEKNICAGKKENAYIALLSVHPMEKQNNDELIQKGEVTAWAVVLGDNEQYQNFDNFIKYVHSANLTLEGSTLTLQADIKLELKFKSEFKVDGQIIETEYKRIECPFTTASRNPENILVHYNNNSLYLDFYKEQRSF
jgi:hypothetical protein